MPGRHDLLRSACIVLIAAWASACTQQPVTAAPKKVPCADAQTQLQLTACWSSLAKEAEQKADSRFQQVRAKLRPRSSYARASAFEEAQAKWREYRDAYCDAVEDMYRGGSMAPMQGASCRVRLAEAREAELKALLSDLAGLADGR